ncbi:MAG TPA: hypothetical protein VF041_20385 [Gemmatimonadaceae bacterium]
MQARRSSCPIFPAAAFALALGSTACAHPGTARAAADTVGFRFASLDPEGAGTDGLETLFHESLHTMDDTVRVALERAGVEASADRALPRATR